MILGHMDDVNSSKHSSTSRGVDKQCTQRSILTLRTHSTCILLETVREKLWPRSMDVERPSTEKWLPPWRLEELIQKAQQDVINSAEAEELLGFKLFWLNRALAITPPRRLKLSQEDESLARPPQDRSYQCERVQNPRGEKCNIVAKHWTAGFLLDFATPAKLSCRLMIKEGPTEEPSKPFERLVGSVSRMYSSMGCKARTAHQARAQRVLRTIDYIVLRRILATKPQFSNSQPQNQQQHKHHVDAAKEPKQYTQQLLVPGYRSLPLMSSLRFAPTVDGPVYALLGGSDE
jgi:hypothetical protein